MYIVRACCRRREDFISYNCATIRNGIIFAERKINMQAIKQEIYTLVESLPDSQLNEIADFILLVKMRDESKRYKELEALSISSTEF